MKKTLIFLLTLTLALSFCACGDGNASDVTSPSDTTSPSPENTTYVSDNTQNDTDSVEKAAAESCVGGTLEQLYNAVGEPNSSAYQDSCEQPDAQDGFLYYEDFTVVTLKTADSETVVRVR